MQRLMVLFSLLAVLTLAAGCAALPAAQAAAPTATAALAAPVQAGDTAADTAPVLSFSSALSALEQTFENIYASVDPSVVNLQVETHLGSGEGSGFVWDTGGHIVTNNHVVAGAERILVTFSDGSAYEGALVGADPESDLAVVKVDAPAELLRPVSLADSRSVQVGEIVAAIGNPYGLSGTMTQGIISALSRSLSVEEDTPYSTGTYTIPDIIQTDAAINPGNSGGVLVDDLGQVVGVTAAIKTTSGANAGIGFVIPAHIVARVVPALIEQGSYEHPRMGFSGATLTPDLARAAGLEVGQRGVLVISLQAGGPADLAGMVASRQAREPGGGLSFTGGDVIVAVDGRAVQTFDQLNSYLFNYTAVGQQVEVTVLRQGVERTLTVALRALD